MYENWETGSGQYYAGFPGAFQKPFVGFSSSFVGSFKVFNAHVKSLYCKLQQPNHICRRGCKRGAADTHRRRRRMRNSEATVHEFGKKYQEMTIKLETYTTRLLSVSPIHTYSLYGSSEFDCGQTDVRTDMNRLYEINW